MIIHITQVKVSAPYSLELTFNDNKRKRINLQHELYGPIFEPLRDPTYFAHARLDPDTHTVCWPNGADFAPEFLYEMEPEMLSPVMAKTTA